MAQFWLCFVPLFVAVDAVGVLPMFMALTEGLARPRLRQVIWQSVATALGVALVFLAVGKGLLALLNITVDDFTIAGGALLFVISLSDLLAAEKGGAQVDVESVGAVPLGVPLIVGPAVLATTLLLIGKHGVVPTIAAIVANVFIAGGVFWMAEPIHRLLGNAGSKTVAKISSLLLAAIAVMMIRQGVVALIERYSKAPG